MPATYIPPDSNSQQIIVQPTRCASSNTYRDTSNTDHTSINNIQTNTTQQYDILQQQQKNYYKYTTYKQQYVDNSIKLERQYEYISKIDAIESYEHELQLLAAAIQSEMGYIQMIQDDMQCIDIKCELDTLRQLHENETKAAKYDIQWAAAHNISIEQNEERQEE